MAYRRKITYNRRRPTKYRRSFRRRKNTYRKKYYKKRKMNINAKPHIIKTYAISYDITMEPSVTPDSSAFAFQTYLQWKPAGSQSASPIKVVLTNNTTTAAQSLGTLPSAESSTWGSLYAKTKLSKVVVKYIPAITQGMSGTSTAGANTTSFNLSAANIMYTIPIYDNVDDIVSASGVVQKDVSYPQFSNTLTKPYTKAHSVYKPWTRVIKPTTFLNTAGYQTNDTTHLFKKNMYIDISNNTQVLNGLLITMPPLSAGGILPATGSDQYIPIATQTVKLGRLQMTYYQKFKTRT